MRCCSCCARAYGYIEASERKNSCRMDFKDCLPPDYKRFMAIKMKPKPKVFKYELSGYAKFKKVEFPFCCIETTDGKCRNSMEQIVGVIRGEKSTTNIAYVIDKILWYFNNKKIRITVEEIK